MLPTLLPHRSKVGMAALEILACQCNFYIGPLLLEYCNFKIGNTLDQRRNAIMSIGMLKTLVLH